MVARGDVGLGDLVTAHAVLSLGPGASAAVVAMLGLVPASLPTEPGPRPAPVRPAPVRRDPAAAPPRARPGTNAGRKPTIRRLRPITREPWIADGANSAADPLPAVAFEALVPRLPHTPLLPRRAAREVFDIAASTWQPTGAVDLRRALATIASGRPVRRLQHVHRPSLVLGLQVLVDQGDGMQPFRRDQREAVASLRMLVGAGLDVRRFLDDPWAGTRPDDDSTWSSTYRPPPPGRPVLVLGTLGRGALPRPDLDKTWRRLAAMLAGQESAVAALVPLHRPLRGPLDVVPWDRVTWRRDAARLRVRRAEAR